MQKISKYQDQNTLWHDKDTKGGKKLSNNWMIYTAYCKLLGLPYDEKLAREYFNKCKVKLRKGEILINRHPNKEDPPLSADELIGAWILGFISYDQIKANHGVFHGKGKPVNAKMLGDIATGILELYVAHQMNVFMPKSKKVKQRNLFWERKIKKLYQIAFRLTPAYMYGIKKASKKKPHEEERLIWKMYVESVLDGGDSTGELSQKNLLWAIARMMGDKRLARKCKPKRNFKKYFGADHPFSKVNSYY